MMEAFDDPPSESWFDYIKETPHKDWNYYALSQNPNITWEIVAANPDKAWKYWLLSQNRISWQPTQTKNGTTRASA